MKLELEITDKMMGELQARADIYAVEPSDVVKSIISCEIARKQQRMCWMDRLATIINRVSDAVIAASEMGIPKEKEA